MPRLLFIPRVSVPFLAALLLAGCGVREMPSGIFDPYETANRETHAFNVALSGVLAGAAGGDSALPEPVLKVAANFAGNLGLPNKIFNSLLQGRVEPAVMNTLRLLVNTTFGVGGLFDAAGTSFGLPEHYTDFGETLYVWGVGEGAYIELPIIGPSTERDAFGRVIDVFIDPLGAVLTVHQHNKVRLIRLTGNTAGNLRYAGSVTAILNESADSYAQARLIYLQNRRFALGATSDEDVFDPYAQ
ncbi:MAG: VacJ family lipoprotein [Phaeovulum sp.]|uniref:MlaA family lipoprotein n=1 Tax=Phaeovulum sp. TaxID=2934796 RepID=UPI00273066CF|nr:VacJ family lipoprotein [Phaeovulum sp.]MDP2063541.1 VacJ family lipoprotein [Phaeovulum sp.]MDP3860023.1 VacJ family lipoprotein [Phaeovulum sp.]